MISSHEQSHFSTIKKDPRAIFCVLIAIFEFQKNTEELQSKLLDHYLSTGAHYFLPQKPLKCVVYFANIIIKSSNQTYYCSQRKKLHRTYEFLLKNKTLHIFGLKPLDATSQNNTYTMRKRNQHAIKLCMIDDDLFNFSE